MSSGVAFLLLAHNDPAEVRRLIGVLDPHPVVVHCDSKTPDDEFAEMLRGARDNVVAVERRRTRWASWAVVEAELDCLRRAVEMSDAEHFVTLSGGDFPALSARGLEAALAPHAGRSVVRMIPLPFENWGPEGGYQRLRYHHVTVNRKMYRWPIPRALPKDLTLVGSTAQRILCRRHAKGVLRACDEHPEYRRYWRTTLSADELFVPSLLATFVLENNDEVIDENPWYVDWQGVGNPSPKWLDESDFDAIVARRDELAAGLIPLLFARKFSSTRSAALADRVVAELHAVGDSA